MIAISKTDLEKQRDILSRRRSTSAASWAIEEEELMDGLMNLLDKLIEGPGSWIHREEGEVVEGPSDEAYIEAARNEYEEEGVVEIDDGAVVSRGSDPGAYVQAWVWVSLDEKYPKEDKCTYCGEHIGWILSEVGAFLSLGVCGKHGCQEQYNEDHEVKP